MLTASQVATMLAMSERAVYDLAKTGKLPSYRMGAGNGAVRFDLQDVEAYKQSCRFTATKRAIAGAMSSRASLADADSELQSYFRQRGIAPKPKPTRTSKTADSSPLRLVPSENSR